MWARERTAQAYESCDYRWLTLFAAKSEEETVKWDQTWPALLANSPELNSTKCNVINRGARKRTIESLLGDDFYSFITLTEPDYLIIQIGIVDCAPRVISRRMSKAMGLSFFPKAIKKSIIRSRSKNRQKILSKGRLKRVYTPKDRFIDYLNRFQTKLLSLDKAPTVIWVPILGHFNQMNKKSPGFSDNLEEYSAALRETLKETDSIYLDELENWWTQHPEYYCADGYHLNIAGNKALAQTLIPKIAHQLSLQKKEALA